MKYRFIYVKEKTTALFSVFVFILFSHFINAQSYFGLHTVNGIINPFSRIQINSNSLCNTFCIDEYIGNNGSTWNEGISMSPEGDLYSLGGTVTGIFLIDTLTGLGSLFYPLPLEFPQTGGFVSTGGGIFYTISNELPPILGDSLLQIDINTGMITSIGHVGWSVSGDITIFNGEFYYICAITTSPLQKGIVKLDINDPSNNELLVTFPVLWNVFGLTASNICNTLIATEYSNSQILYVNLLDGAIIPICEFPVEQITSMLEFGSPTICDVLIDLDCNDSSGADNADFNADEFDCLSDPVQIADDDIGMLYDAVISEMTIQITGSVPDAPFEILVSTGNITNIDVTGSGTDMVTLVNAGGAKSTDFKDALRLLVYDNIALPPTAGLRTVEVQFTTESGEMSNIATAYIQVNELPLVNLDLGPDQEICQGQSATFNAGNPGAGATFQWSSGQSTQSITVSQEDEYIVTVSNSTHCPNQDTVFLDILPVIHVSLTGPDVICDNQQASLTINTDATFPLTVEISAEPGSLFIFNNVIGNYTFQDIPSTGTVYTITNVNPSEGACIVITDPVHEVDVYPTYNHQVEASICDGDSIWLGYYWETEPGVYEIILNTVEDCDSIVTTTITVLPAINVSKTGTTCDSSEVGIFFEYLNNPNGCDTVVQTTVSLLPSDTTLISLTDCNAADTGVFQQVLTNINGCDSIVITDVNYSTNPYTYIDVTTCDSSLLGVTQQLFLNQTGCDSIVVTTVSIAPSDTSYLFGISCDPASIGVFESLLSNQSGCDSLVITTISAGIPDTNYIQTTSCDSASLGVFEEHFIGQSGCDSTVFTTITYSASDSTFTQSASCDPSEVGVFIQQLVNRFGCDSIVTETVTLLPSHETFLTFSTCDPSASGVFVQTLTNVNGCDSIVTETVELLPSDETFLYSTTCMSSQAGMFITTHFNQYGCDSVVTSTVSLIPADTTILSFKTCDPAQVGSIENTFTNQDGCDSLVIEHTSLYSLPELQIEVTSDFNGYAISCFGENDGSLSAEVTGIQPWTYLWSTGDTDQTITGLSAGSYAVTVTDGNGCMTSDDVILFEPEEFSISFIISQPDCFDHQSGSITIVQTGGIEPIRYSIDEVNYQSSPVFDQLSGGKYTITALDANDCEVKEIIWINVPLMVHVELGDDQVVIPGDTVIINAIVNVPFDSLSSITWSGLSNPNCPDCLTQPVAPIITTTYSVTVTSLDGCMDEDALTLFLERYDDVFVPNIFSPNGDGINDKLLISGGSDVKEILSMIIFDRWGNSVFSANNFLPNDVSQAWDGLLKGKALNPGVFAYRMIVDVGGRQEIVYGDVTLVR